MAGILARIFPRNNAAMNDASRIYGKLMAQSRRPEFYGEGKVPDSYNGRIDLLTLHIAAVLKALTKFPEQGERLSQAIYDVMRDDFEIALREEGMSDTGVKRRIKPIMRLFFTRVKSYVEALQSNDRTKELQRTLSDGLLADAGDNFAGHLSTYAAEFSDNLTPISLGDLASGEFTFPQLH